MLHCFFSISEMLILFLIVNTKQSVVRNHISCYSSFLARICLSAGSFHTLSLSTTLKWRLCLPPCLVFTNIHHASACSRKISHCCYRIICPAYAATSFSSGACGFWVSKTWYNSERSIWLGHNQTPFGRILWLFFMHLKNPCPDEPALICYR